MSSLALTLSSVALKEIISQMTKKVLEKPWRKDTTDGRDILSQLSEEYILDTYTEKYVSKYLKIRTLHSAEHDIYINEIYSPLTLQAKSNVEICIDDNFTLNYSKIVNIIGIAGQGKSTILRKIFLEETKRGDVFPFFIELRKLDNLSILDYFKKSLNEVGIDTNNAKVEYLLQSRKTLLLLDGFDEIPSKERVKKLTEIVSLNTQFNARIIVTSRPGTEICHEPDIANLTVKSLNKDDVINIITKLDHINSLSELKTLLDNNHELTETLKTPILVNLLYVCYPYLDVVPENVVDFYDKLFLTLYSRHDKIKNFNREKYSSIPASKANDIFNALCFESIRKDYLEFNESILNDVLISSLKICDSEKENLENIKQDIINITCLIQKDGFDRYVYLHRSVQEFHAAKFISSLPLISKRKIYSKLKDNLNISDSFYGVIGFLMDIDIHDFSSELVLSYMNDIGLNDLCHADKREARLKSITESMVNNLYVEFTYSNDTVEFEALESLDGHKNIRAMNLFSKKITTVDSSLGFDFAIFELLDSVVEIINKNTDSLKKEQLISFVKENTKKRTGIIGEVKDEALMLGTILKIMEDDSIYILVSDYILWFYNTHYKMIAERINRMTSAIDIDWNS
ncbi:NACHT domain-containing protein [Aeromonas veronii]|uniref:NACHT domain-containing protein n=1 Tax=Aeromonas veronii TaxID=654 RepID=UPI003CF8F563